MSYYKHCVSLLRGQVRPKHTQSLSCNSYRPKDSYFFLLHFLSCSVQVILRQTAYSPHLSVTDCIHMIKGLKETFATFKSISDWNNRANWWHNEEKQCTELGCSRHMKQKATCQVCWLACGLYSGQVCIHQEWFAVLVDYDPWHKCS